MTQPADRADIVAPRSTRIAALVAVGLLHLVAALALVRAFAPDATRQAVDRVVSAFTVTITPPDPAPPPPPPPDRSDPGAAGDPGKKAVPKAVSAPRPRVAIATQLAPPVAGTGPGVSAGAAEAGAGTGASGQGNGSGSGAGGNGTGAGGGAKPVKIAGDINSARDYPIASRELRIGDFVIVAITVDRDGKPSACRIHRPSRDADADAITCRLAMQRFRFRPATDADGQPIASVYGWRQTWHYRAAP